jgi:dihydroneopterin aldolase
VDRILLEGMSFFGHHGVYPVERELGTHFTVDVELRLDLAAAGRSDRIEDTIDYRDAHRLVREVVEGEPCSLLEAVAERAASRLLTLERVAEVRVAVRKRPPMRGEFRSVGVEVSRGR